MEKAAMTLVCYISTSHHSFRSPLKDST